jgi:predicted transcriptional regulator
MKEKMKKPISITLSPEVLAALDKAAGNRSRYIEWLIRQDLKLGFKPAKKESKE